VNTLSTTDRLSIALKLEAIGELRDQLFESLIDAEDPKAVLATVNELHNQAADALAQVVGLCRQPGEYSFVGANVALPAERTAAEDKASQRFVETRRAG
jgi:hypothetical protein